MVKNRKMSAHEVVVFLLKILLWIPCDAILHRRWAWRLFVFFHVTYKSLEITMLSYYSLKLMRTELFHFVPKIFLFAFGTYDIFLFTHSGVFLHKQLKNSSSFRRIKNTTKCCEFNQNSQMILFFLLTSALIQIALTCTAEATLWPAKYVEFLFGQDMDPTVGKAYASLFVLWRTHENSLYFLFPAYISGLFQEVNSALDDCSKMLQSPKTGNMDSFAKKFHSTVNYVSEINSVFDTNITWFVFLSTSKIVCWLYMAFMLEECIGSWSFAQAGCSALTLMNLLLCLSTVNTKVHHVQFFLKSSYQSTQFISQSTS